ncbi:hypothetical protein CERZMDRAFT_90675 [Cercospora zeae-maydis SCOH1-5]|uniref:Uncharacterized protein n=1 Tax=Cercospora zeae-maydis SCOH1-5 TaxID=717836 RepID=A0A6A6FH82_9PEZI|nr:hypothetical protein CERZMDRAFT_90675 [Cercospora zeae-maydis SCOH1-5]
MNPGDVHMRRVGVGVWFLRTLHTHSAEMSSRLKFWMWIVTAVGLHPRGTGGLCEKCWNVLRSMGTLYCIAWSSDDLSLDLPSLELWVPSVVIPIDAHPGRLELPGVTSERI